MLKDLGTFMLIGGVGIFMTALALVVIGHVFIYFGNASQQAEPCTLSEEVQVLNKSDIVEACRMYPTLWCDNHLLTEEEEKNEL